ncbi:hypothetical protein GCM10022402_34220 [Salinactinospora qingdaonensis]|uniref:Uncharacterized protein n=1 Tax=Salinactinospora qingdaonensis TaxID=702744 RepID=A0ABP7FZL4_9ACTN
MPQAYGVAEDSRPWDSAGAAVRQRTSITVGTAIRTLCDNEWSHQLSSCLGAHRCPAVVRF